MPGRRVAGPFWAQAVNQKKLYVQIGIYKTLPLGHAEPLHIPANVQIVCGDRKLRPFDPRYALADPPVEFCRLDSKPISYVPSDVPASVPRSKTGEKKPAPMLFAYHSGPRFCRRCRREILNPNITVVKTIVPFQRPIYI